MKDKFYNGRYDAVFKNAVVNDEEIFKWFLELSINKKIKHYKIISNELPKKNNLIKGKTLDVNISTDIGKIILEINNGYYTSLPTRNLAYLSSVFGDSVFKGESYDNVPLHILLNITWGLGTEGKIITDYYMQSNTGEMYSNKMRIREINMDLLLKMWYHGDKEKALKYSHFLMLGLEKKDLDTLNEREENRYMERYTKNVNKLNEDPEFIQVISDEKDTEMLINTLKNEARAEAKEEGKEEGLKEGIKEGIKKGLKEGKEQGIKQEKINTAKNMLKENVSMEIIMKVTGLTKEEIEKLK